MVIKTKEGVWFWQKDGTTWEEYEDEISKKIEGVHLKAAKGSSSAVSVSKDKFVSLADMKQFNFAGTDKKGIPVKREEKTVKVTWQWENGDHWEDYNDATAKTIETGFLGKEEKVSLDSERFVSFAKMRQIRFDNEKRYRNVRREVVTEVTDGGSQGEDEEEKEKEEEKEEEDGEKDEKKKKKKAKEEDEDEDDKKDEEEEEVEEKVVKWYWDKSSDDDDEDAWVEFNDKMTEQIEEGYQKYLEGDGAKTYPVDKERHINYRKMRQVRNDDKERYRKVKRGITTITVKKQKEKKEEKEKEKEKKGKKDTKPPASPPKTTSTPTTTPDKKDKEDKKADKKDVTPTKASTTLDGVKKDTTPSKTDTTPTKKDTTPNTTPKTKSPSTSFTSSSTTTTTTTTSTSSSPSSSSPSASGDSAKKMGKRSYSDMSEEEKKEMIMKMLNNNTDDSGAKKIKVATSGLMLPGEEDILQGKVVMKYCLKPNRYFDSSVADLHFRTAESQFHRLMETNTQSKVALVEYIVNPDLVAKFEAKRKEFEKQGYGKPLLAFHGTAQKNIFNICKTNFCVPGQGVAHATDTGWYGKGIYFSEYPDYSMGYIKDCTRLLLSKVLLGKSFQCKGLITGQPLMKGYDSHVSPCGKELVIFSPDQILPIYVVHYSLKTGGGLATGLYSFGPVSSVAMYMYHKSVVFKGLTFAFHGCPTPLTTLETAVKNNGGTTTTVVKYVNYLVTTATEFAAKSLPITTAQNAGGTFIVSEEFIAECIKAGKIKKASKYAFEKKEEKTGKSDDDIKAVPLTAGTDDEEDDGEDEKPLPMCKFGENCYRKNAEHFKSFAHPWLI